MNNTDLNYLNRELCIQSDSRWATDIMDGNKDYRIGKVGCAITALVNVCRINTNRQATPKELNNYLNRNNGYQDGAVVWEKARRGLVLGMIEPFWWQKKEGEAKPLPDLDFDKYSYILRFMNGNIFHFSNLVGVNGDYVIFYDVYDGRFKALLTDKVLRIIRIKK